MVAMLVELLLLALSVLAMVPACVLFLQIAAATRRRAPAGTLPDAGRARSQNFAVLMPAHDEAGGIARSIRAVLGQLAPGDRLLVVADNCTDATAAVARTTGAEVVERHDPARRGKGYALDHGVRWLERDPPAVVIVVDADCIPAPRALERIATLCLATHRPVQALYLMRAPPGAGVGTRIAEFAWMLKNKLRPAGSAVFGWPCQLMGTGMAFRWQTIRQARLASGHLVEDMQLGAELAASGTPPLFCEQALVESVFPADIQGAKSQRTRWEHGHLTMIASAGPRLLAQALTRRDLALMAMALDLIVPPLASLALVLGVFLIVDAAWWMAGRSPMPLAASGLACGLLVAAVATAWRSEGRALVSKSELLALPLYILAKVPVYVRLFTKRQVDWVRTKRDDRHP